MTTPTPVFAKKTVSETIQVSTIASRPPTVKTTKITATKVVSGAPQKKIVKKPVVKKVVKAVVAKPAPVVSSSGRPQRAAAANFLNKLDAYRKQLATYRAAVAQYEKDISNGVKASKPKKPDIPQEFVDALRSDETEDDSDVSEEEEEEEDDDDFDEDDGDDDE